MSESPPEPSGCTCEKQTIRLLNSDHGFRRFCFRHADEANGRDGWRDACGDLFRAKERERDRMMMREFAR